MIIFVTSGDYNLITNAAFGDGCHPISNPKEEDDKNFCVLTWVTQFSLANKRDKFDLVEI